MLLKGLMSVCVVMYLTKTHCRFFQSLKGNSIGNCDIYRAIIVSPAIILPFNNRRLFASLPLFLLGKFLALNL